MYNKLVASAALAAAAIGIGGLATAPSASAAPARVNCKDLAWKAEFYSLMGDQAFDVHNYALGGIYWGRAAAYQDVIDNYC
jgi:hypothetical protein